MDSCVFTLSDILLQLFEKRTKRVFHIAAVLVQRDVQRRSPDFHSAQIVRVRDQGEQRSVELQRLDFQQFPAGGVLHSKLRHGRRAEPAKRDAAHVHAKLRGNDAFDQHAEQRRLGDDCRQ
jgi:hypothetical protein